MLLQAQRVLHFSASVLHICWQLPTNLSVYRRILVSQASPPYENIEKGSGQNRVSQRNVFGYTMITLLVCGFRMSRQFFIIA